MTRLLTVLFTRRNPVLADVLNRLGYMERKGSGFGYHQNKEKSCVLLSDVLY